MPQFFINRPVFAWVLAIFIVLFGLLAIPRLAVERYPSVAPPSVSITATYPGATPQTMTDSVVSLIERELSSVKNVLYFESSTDTSGMATITVTFKPGTDPDMGQVDIQNRLKTIEARLPQTVRQNGLTIDAAGSGFLMIVGLTSRDGSLDEVALGDYMARNMVEELRRVSGVGKVQLFSSEGAMRIWVNPDKLIQYSVGMSDVVAAISAQNVQIAPGRVGDAPAVPGQRVSVPLTVSGQLQTVDQFANIVLRASSGGSRVVLGDVARVELGAQSSAFGSREDGKPAAGAAIQLAPGANAVATAQAVKTRLEELQKTMPSAMRVSIPFDTSPFVRISIKQVVHTLFEAMVLVFLVMYLFLQNVRATIIPSIVAPIALLGTFAVMLLAGFSINVLTMFGMVLAIGIIVDDAIVGITLVLTAVFIPMALASGSVGAIYRQFSLSMAVSILLSALLALSLTPALCATLLKPIDADHHEKKGFFGWFNRSFDRATGVYGRRVQRTVERLGRTMLVFAALCVALVLCFGSVPSSFLPEEDQGYFITSIQLPTEATTERTLDVVKKFEHYMSQRKGIASNQTILGFSFAGSGSNAAMAFTMLKDWKSREGATAQQEVADAQVAMADGAEGQIMVLMPPAIDSLGNSAGFSLRLQDRAGLGFAALSRAQDTLLGLAAQSSKIAMAYPDGLPSGSSVRLDINREKADALGVSFTSISDTLSAAMGSQYVNDFPNRGRMQQVIVQADAQHRMQVGDVLKLNVRNTSGGMVALSELVTPVWSSSPLQLVRYQGYPAMRIAGSAAPGTSSGEAMAEMERLAAQLPPGFAVEWTGQSLQEQESASQAPMLMLLSMLVVFLVLAALYESWSIPVSVMLVVPLGLFGAVIAVMLRGMPNDVFFKVGMITVIGLSAKNAILIVEFAKQLHEQGRTAISAAVEAARLRLRPILMTSMAFGLGVVPLMLASGASAETQHAIGTGVFGGVVAATVLAIFFVPAFYVLVQSAADYLQGLRGNKHRKDESDMEASR